MRGKVGITLCPWTRREDSNTGRYAYVLDTHQMSPSVSIIIFRKVEGNSHEPGVKMDRKKYWTFEEKIVCVSSGP